MAIIKRQPSRKHKQQPVNSAAVFYRAPGQATDKCQVKWTVIPDFWQLPSAAVSTDFSVDLTIFDLYRSTDLEIFFYDY